MSILGFNEQGHGTVFDKLTDLDMDKLSQYPCGTIIRKQPKKIAPWGGTPAIDIFVKIKADTWIVAYGIGYRPIYSDMDVLMAFRTLLPDTNWFINKPVLSGPTDPVYNITPSSGTLIEVECIEGVHVDICLVRNQGYSTIGLRISHGNHYKIFTYRGIYLKVYQPEGDALEIGGETHDMWKHAIITPSERDHHIWTNPRKCSEKIEGFAILAIRSAMESYLTGAEINQVLSQSKIVEAFIQTMVYEILYREQITYTNELIANYSYPIYLSYSNKKETYTEDPYTQESNPTRLGVVPDTSPGHLSIFVSNIYTFEDSSWSRVESVKPVVNKKEASDSLPHIDSIDF